MMAPTTDSITTNVNMTSNTTITKDVRCEKSSSSSTALLSPSDDSADKSLEMSMTTTLSTLVVTSKNAKIVIAILQSGRDLSIKILEMEPNIASLESGFEEAAKMQSQHQELIQSLKSKQCPVEELLRKADDLITNQKPNAEVYSSMAESLGAAWRQLNEVLDLRKSILDKNFLFQGHFKEYKQKVSELERLCQDQHSAKYDIGIEKFVDLLLNQKRQMLESSVFALQEGDALLKLLDELFEKAAPLVDSRPKVLKISLNLSIEQVALWLEDLHERRVKATRLLEQKMAKLQGNFGLESQIQSLERIIEDRILALESSLNLGTSTSQCDKLLTENMSKQAEANDLITKASNIIKDIEGLSMETSVRALAVYERAKKYQELLDQASGLIAQSGTFFNTAKTIEYDMDELEAKIKQVDPLNNEKHSIISNLDATFDSVQCSVSLVKDEGEKLVDSVNNEKASYGVKNVMDNLTRRLDHVNSLLTLKTSQLKQTHNSTLKGFSQKLENINKWLEDELEGYLRSSNTFGFSSESIRVHLESLKEVTNKIHMKTFELEGLKCALNSLVEQSQSDDLTDIESEMQKITDKLQETMTKITQRLKIGEELKKFANLLRQFESDVESCKTQKLDESYASLRESSQVIKQLNVQVKHLGHNLLKDLEALHDPYIEKSSTMVWIQDGMRKSEQRCQEILRTQDMAQAELEKARRFGQEWNAIEAEKRNSVEISDNLNNQLFPIFANLNTEKPKEVVIKLEERLIVLPKQKLVSDKMSNIIQRVEQMYEKLPEPKKYEAQKMTKDLKQKVKSFEVMMSDYELILQMSLSFFKNFESLQATTNNIMQSNTSKIPNNVAEAELMAREHEAAKQSVTEIITFVKGERDNLLRKMGDLKSRQLLREDEKKLSQIFLHSEHEFDKFWMEKKETISQHARFCIFAQNLKNLLDDIDEVVGEIKTRQKIGPLETSVTATEEFLRNVKLSLERFYSKIEICRREGHDLTQKMPFHSAAIDMGVTQLSDKMKTFTSEIQILEAKLHNAKEYFKCVNGVQGFVRLTRQSLLKWSQELTKCASEQEIHELKTKVDEFITKNKEVQQDSIMKLMMKSAEIYDEPNQGRCKEIQKELNETLDAVHELKTQVDENLSKKIYIHQISTKIKLEQEQRIFQAKIEVEAAKKAAEEAKLAAQEAVNQARIDLEQKSERHTELNHRKEAPQFTENLKDMVINEGEACHMAATLTGSSAIKITWFKDGVPITNNADYKARFENGICSLTIDESFVEDSANWSVRASNSAGYEESHAKLTVKELKSEEKPFVMKPLPNVFLKPNDSLELICKFGGYPEPQVSWFRNDLCIDRSKSYVIGERNGDNVLRLANMSAEDSGKFSAKASNIHGSVVISCSVKVKPEIEQEAPVIVESLKNIQCMEGQPLSLRCTVKGMPKPTIVWYKNGTVLASNNGYKTKYLDKAVTLCKKIVSFEDQGFYKIEAFNDLGKCQTSCNVNILANIEMEKSEPTSSPKIKRSNNPKFISPIRSKQAKVGERVVFDAVYDGFPSPAISWQKDGIALSGGPNMKILCDKNKASLRISKVTINQTGQYTCKAENNGGATHCTANLEVYSDELLPHFSEGQNCFLNGYVGQEIVISSKIKGLEPYQAQWYKNGKELHPAEGCYSMANERNLFSLKLQNPKESDSACFSLRVTNRYGTNKKDFHLTIQKEPLESIVTSESVSSRRHLSSDSRVLDVVLSHKRKDKPLPDLLPFPFKPDPMDRRPRSKGTVAMPSKFIPGKIRHSAYNSGSNEKMKTKWRAYSSDTEDTNFQYSKVTPKLTHKVKQNVQRVPSPPCPHVWESHEDIDKLQQELQSFGYKSTSRRAHSVEVDSFCFEKKSFGYPKYERTLTDLRKCFTNGDRTTSQRKTMSPVVPCIVSKPKDPSPETMRGQNDNKSEYIRVRDKVKMLEKKVEEDFILYESECSEPGSRGGTPSIRPKDIPGAVRVLPTLSGPVYSRFNTATLNRFSIEKSMVHSVTNSIAYTTNKSIRCQSTPPGTSAFSLQQLEPFPFSPDPIIDLKRNKSPIPPPKPSKFVKGQFAKSDYESDLECVIPPVWKPETPVKTFTQSTNCEKQMSASFQAITSSQDLSQKQTLSHETSVSTSNARMDKAVRSATFGEMETSSIPSLEMMTSGDSSIFDKSKTTDEASKTPIADTVTDSECDEVQFYFSKSQTSDIQYKSSPKSKRYHNKKPDGYEADTDDTLTRKRRSVKEIAKTFQDAENICPSPWPIRPKTSFSESEYESDFEGRSWSRASRAGFFKSSKAYIPPKWAPTPTEDKTVMKVNEMTESTQRSVSMHQQTRIIRFNQQNISDKDFPESFASRQEANNTFSEKVKENEIKASRSIPVFKPKKFVPSRLNEEKISFSGTDEALGDKLKVRWNPSDSEAEEPSYRKVVPQIPKDQKPMQTESDRATPHVYRNSTRTCNKGVKKIDPQTGLIYFKYDFGYEFGVVTPEMNSNESLAIDDDNSILIEYMGDDITPMVGSEVRINVVLKKGVEKEEVCIEWRKNEQPICETDRIQILQDGCDPSLIIKNVMTEDNGKYSCTVTSPKASETKSCCVTVKGETLL